MSTQPDLIKLVCTPRTFRPETAEGCRWLDPDSDADFELWRDSGVPFAGGPLSREDWERDRAEGRPHCVIVEDRRIASTATQWQRSEQEWELTAVWTHPEYRLQGRASAVCCVVTARTLQAGRPCACTVHADNVPMLALLERLGYERRAPAPQAEAEPRLGSRLPEPADAPPAEQASHPGESEQATRMFAHAARRNVLCPECGLGLMPTAEYCPRCGTPAPAWQPTSDEVERDRRRRRMRLAEWFFDLFPGLLSWRVVAVALCMWALAFMMGRWVVPMFTRISGGFDALFYLPAATLLGGLALLATACGFIWIHVGAVYSVRLAVHDMKGRHWVALLVLMVLAVRLFLFVAS